MFPVLDLSRSLQRVPRNADSRTFRERDRLESERRDSTNGHHTFPSATRATRRRLRTAWTFENVYYFFTYSTVFWIWQFSKRQNYLSLFLIRPCVIRFMIRPRLLDRIRIDSNGYFDRARRSRVASEAVRRLSWA